MHFSAGGSYNSILPDLEELEIYFSSTGSHAYTIIDYKCFLHFSKLSENENLVKYSYLAREESWALSSRRFFVCQCLTLFWFQSTFMFVLRWFKLN